MMKIIGCDFHPGYQQVVLWDQETGEVLEKALPHILWSPLRPRV